jgi:hypothetical protein
LSESSLALAPTLSTVSQPGARIEALVPAAPTGGDSSSGSVSTGVPASNAVRLISADENSQPARGAPNHAVALNAFLDLNTSQEVPRKKAAVQRPGSNQHAIGAHSLPSADHDTGTEGLPSEAYVEELRALASDEQGPEAVPPGQAGEVFTGIAPESRSESANERAGGKARDETQDGGAWTNLTNLLLVASVSMIGAYWPMVIHSNLRTKSRP